MKHTLKKILGALALAAGFALGAQAVPVVKIVETGAEHETAQAAIAAATAGQTVQLLTNVTENLTLAVGQTNVLDLSGWMLCAANGDDPAIMVEGGLTLIDTSENKTGVVTNGTNGINVYGTLEMYGGKVTGNTSGVSVSGDGVMTIGGDAKIVGNSIGNLLLSSGKVCSIATGAYAPTANMEIGVTTSTAPTASAPVAVTSNRGEDYGYFTSDNAAYAVANLGSVVKLAMPVVETISADGATTNRFGSLSDAYSAVTAGETLRLLADQSTNFRIGKSITFDLGGHTISGTDVILVNSGATVVVSNGTIQASSDKSCCGVNDSTNGGSLYVQDVTLKGFNAHYGSGGDTYFGKGVVCNTTSLYSSNGSGRLHVTDGLYTFTRLDCVSYTPSTARLFLTGGCFTYNSSTLANYLKSGYTVSACQHGRGSSYHDVVFNDAQYVARVDHPASGSIESTKFASLEDAISAANSGDTVVLMTNRTESVTLSNKAITLDLNEKRLAGTGLASCIKIETGASLIVTNGTLTTDGKVFMNDGAAISCAGELALYDVHVEDAVSAGKGAVYFNGVSFTVGGDVYASMNTNAAGVINNVYLASGKKITISSAYPLSEGSQIGITTEAQTAAIDVTKNGTDSDKSYFTSDSSAYVVAYSTDHVILTYRKQDVFSHSGFTGYAVGFPGSMQVYANLRALPYSEVAALANGTMILFSSEDPDGASWTSVPAGSAKLTLNYYYDSNTYPRTAGTGTMSPYSQYTAYTLVKGVKVNQAGTGFDTCTEGSLSAYNASDTKLAYFCLYGGAKNIPGYAADFQITKVDSSTDYTVNSRPSYYDLYGETEVDIRNHIELLWGDVNISKGTVVTWIDCKATFTKDSTDAERTIQYKVNDATVTVVCPKILPPPTLLYTPVKDDVVYYPAGTGPISVPWQEDDVMSGKIVLTTNKCWCATNALDYLLSPALTVDAEGKVTYTLGELDGGEWYGYYIGDDGYLSKPVPFYMAPKDECLLTLKTVDGSTFLDGTTETNIVYTHWTKTDEPAEVVNADSDMLFMGWFYDAGHTNAFTFGERLTSNTTAYACWRIKTGITAGYYWTENNPDVAAMPGYGQGWTYVETNGTLSLSSYMNYYHRLQGVTTNTTLVVSSGADSYIKDLTVDARELDRSPLKTDSYAYLYVYGTNKLYSAQGIPTIALGGYYNNLYLYGDGALFVYPGEGADPASFATGCRFYIYGGTYNIMSWTNYVSTSSGYYGFDNHDGTFTAKGAEWVTYHMLGKAADVTEVVVRYQSFSPIADPEAEGFTFGGWCSDEACQTPYTAWYASYTSNYKIHLYARWDADIVYDAAGGKFSDGTAEKSSPCEFRSKYTLPSETPTRDGYTFLGWYAGVTNGAPQVTSATDYQSLNINRIFAKWTSTKITTGETYLDGVATADGFGLTNVSSKATYPDGNIVIPDRIGNDAGSKAVVSIAAKAFVPTKYSATITSVTLPTFLTEIGQRAFMGNAALTNLTFAPVYDYKTGEKATLYIKNYAFANTAITNLVFPAGGSYKLGYLAFSHLPNLKDVYILGDVSLDGFDKAPFREIGEDCGGTTFHLSPAAFANAKLVYALTNGLHMVQVRETEPVVSVDDDPLGLVEGTLDVGETEISIEFTLPENAPWTTVSTNTVSLFYSKTLTELQVGNCERIFAKEVQTVSATSYRAVFDKPEGATGFFTVCVGD